VHAEVAYMRALLLCILLVCLRSMKRSMIGSSVPYSVRSNIAIVYSHRFMYMYMRIHQVGDSIRASKTLTELDLSYTGGSLWILYIYIFL
jgi:hypothetical protein